ncbi:MAG: ABC transporter substrate-binding protein [Anaerolineaceae bacterium]|nr:ABC transporter substrate-binding protein [Anaerolineaceae bacterium]
MYKLKTHFIAGFISLTLLTLLSFNLAYGQSAPVFRIGVLDDQQGPIANGARLAVHDINAAGGVRGADGTQFQLELIIQPIAGTNVTNTIASLRDASLIAVLGPESDSNVKDNLPALQALSVPVLTPADGDTTLTDDQSGRIFRTRAAQLLQGRALANVLTTDYNLKRIATAQLDNELETSAGVVGFTISLTSLSITPQLALQVQSDNAITQAVQQINSNNIEAVVAYGDPQRAGKLLSDLRAAGFQGQFVYNQADNGAFQIAAGKYIDGTFASITWPFTAEDANGRLFRDKYIQLYGKLPGPIEAASYDSITLLSAAINRPGELQTNLTQLDNVAGVQGTLRPAQLQKGETSDNVAVVQYGEYGSPQILARFAGSQRLDINLPVLPTLEPTVEATATPQGVVITVKQAKQNVRTGPSTAYDVIGQVSKDEQYQVIGATGDNAWVVINFRGQQGWLATYLLDVFGNIQTVPIINPPPTPTPPPSPTPLPVTATPFSTVNLVAGNFSFVPGSPNCAETFNVFMDVANLGSSITPGGTISVNDYRQADNAFQTGTTAAFPSLAPGQTVNVGPIPLTVSTYYNENHLLIMTVDSTNAIFENNETDNVRQAIYFLNKAGCP